ncbi:hypothetical protein R3P38DRAFT_3030074 [Favolaschia claudopus]|uniref:Uncharacterized protein n=1 Tax=Favolaschia claudopus TaxID=2862362 RepID=A0AAW0ADN3_9AGAR
MNSTSMNYNIDWVDEKIIWIQGATSLVLYGLYVALFLLSLYTLSCRRTRGTRLLVIASYVMAVMGTVQIALTIAYALNELNVLQGIAEGNEGKIASAVHAEQGLTIARNVTFTVNNFITDCIFMYRCYVIWSYKMKPIILPAFLLVLTLGIGCYTSVVGPDMLADVAPYILAAATNLCLTALTAGRILWVLRTASATPFPDSPTPRRYKIALGVILESGAVYFLVSLILAFSFSMDVGLFPITWAIAMQLTGGLLADYDFETRLSTYLRRTFFLRPHWYTLGSRIWRKMRPQNTIPPHNSTEPADYYNAVPAGLQ